MTVITPDTAQVIVFPRHAHALVRVDRPGVRPVPGPEEDVLELHHSGIGEEQPGTPDREERGRGDNGVASLGEEIEKRAAYLGSAHRHSRLLPGGFPSVTCGRHWTSPIQTAIIRHPCSLASTSPPLVHFIQMDAQPDFLEKEVPSQPGGPEGVRTAGANQGGGAG